MAGRDEVVNREMSFHVNLYISRLNLLDQFRFSSRLKFSGDTLRELLVKFNVVFYSFIKIGKVETLVGGVEVVVR